MITILYFLEATGRFPQQDDLERSNCKLAGQVGHKCCGWDYDKNLPVFEVLALKNERTKP